MFPGVPKAPKGRITMSKVGSLSIDLKESARLHGESEVSGLVGHLEDGGYSWEGRAHLDNTKRFYTLLKHILVIVRSLDLRHISDSPFFFIGDKTLVM